PPSFIHKPDPQEVLPGSNVKFTSVVTGTAPLKVSWFKGTTELVAGRQCYISLSDSTAILELLNVESSQSGDYICQVSNEAGKVSCTTKLFVKEPAVFQKKLKDCSVVLGKSVCLDCTYTGTPEIKVSWKKNGLVIFQSDKHIL
ncbi:hypothetical protein chiPu_0029554, partial [Chiloscyllium punctatum]|nr:hypothetical protein [Chiloscyllium punctatum]